LGKVNTYHIHLSGIVQGIGFRPMLYNYAIKNSINGLIYNSSEGLHFEFNSNESDSKKIFKDIKFYAPKYAKIINATLNKVVDKKYTSISINNSKTELNNSVLLTPDFSICDECIEDINNINNRRYRYPFTTCNTCGPRYSIINKLPYDRINTTMKIFKLCNDCNIEYYNIHDRRYFAQTISCPNCGPTMKVYDNFKNLISEGNEVTLNFIKEQLEKGKIIAIKGIGGYLLICDATNVNTIKTLRIRKERQNKPFAIMVRDINQASEYAFICDIQKEQLTSNYSPIVLLKKKVNNAAMEEIAPGLSNIGIMLPYSPLFNIILKDFDKPIIATSGNISGSPIIYNDSDAIKNLSQFADFIITNNRDIVMPQDDSIVTITNYKKQRIILRRSRGMAPSFFHSLIISDKILGTGALLKSSFSFSENNNIYVSQYFGNTDNYDTQIKYKDSLQYLQKIVNTNSQSICTDLHPEYYSNQLAHNLSNNVIKIQHHKAHFTSVLAENNLLESTEPILGVIWDGTGLGDDNQIWGSEFFVFENNLMIRRYCFDSFPQLFGDKMSKEPRLSALSICKDVLGSEPLIRPKFSDKEWALFNKVLRADDLLKVNSMGRIFDAVASLLNICDIQNYEGEAAMKLQLLAESYFEHNSLNMKESYFVKGAHLRRIPTVTLFNGIVKDIIQKRSNFFIAAKLHFSLVQIIEIVAENTSIRNIAFSGGVFQNKLIVSLLEENLENKYNLFFNNQLSPNDENISFGQLIYYNQNIDNIKDLNTSNN